VTFALAAVFLGASESELSLESETWTAFFFSATNFCLSNGSSFSLDLESDDVLRATLVSFSF